MDGRVGGSEKNLDGGRDAERLRGNSTTTLPRQSFQDSVASGLPVGFPST
jgi:hypothetical protein